jgi:SOS-response transcriptional repressor LexA
MSKTPAERLKELRERRFATAKEAADAFGWNEVTYRSHESGGRNIPTDTAKKYASALGSTAAHILGLSNIPAPTVGINHVINVPLVGRVSAGSFRFDEFIQTKGMAVPAVPRDDIPATVQYAVEVDGPSVDLRIADGAYAICAPLEHYPGTPRHGQLVHVVRSRAGLFESTIKELHYTRDGMVLMPCSKDARFQEVVEMNAAESDTTVEIRGIVIGSFQPF